MFTSRLILTWKVWEFLQNYFWISNTIDFEKTWKGRANLHYEKLFPSGFKDPHAAELFSLNQWGLRSVTCVWLPLVGRRTVLRVITRFTEMHWQWMVRVNSICFQLKETNVVKDWWSNEVGDVQRSEGTRHQTCSAWSTSLIFPAAGNSLYQGSM